MIFVQELRLVFCMRDDGEDRQAQLLVVGAFPPAASSSEVGRLLGGPLHHVVEVAVDVGVVLLLL